ncbi:Arabinogalactan peptide [Melia azedarach]|uniref:Arabinogalactan peptide n=1 Tax=Melia azedarach TaxID=155640 RepID=A0ACC1X437_MELAZ|nr:Arabinogalactan peptide [Melia azedarach]
MVVCRASFNFFAIVAIVYAMISLPIMAHGESTAPAPAPTSDGTSIDQGIGYVLKLVALTLTYLIH